MKKKRFLPNEHKKSIYDIDLVKLYNEGKRLILTDLDNTLVCYNTHEPHEKLIGFINEAIEVGFIIKILSNTTNKKRVQTFGEGLNLEAHGNAKKPLTKKMKNLSKEFSSDQVIMIGDQMMTDVWAGNKLGYYTIFVNAINRKTDKLYTRFNRKIEKRLIKKYTKKGWLKMHE